MTEIELLIAGIAAGAVYGLLALGLVVVHSATHVVNFTQGSLAAIAAYIFLGASTSLPLAVRILLAIVLTAAISGLIQLTVVAWAQRLGEMNAVLATVALLFITDGLIREIWGPSSLAFPRFLPDRLLSVGGLEISTVHFAVIAVVTVTAVSYWLLIRHTSVGLIIRGTADNPRAARLMGISPAKVSFVVWTTGGVLAAIAGLLLGHLLTPRPEMALGILIKAFAGAVIGGFASPLGALGGAILLGVAEVFTAYYIGSLFQDAVPLVLLVLFLAFRPSDLAGVPVRRAI